MTIDMSAPVTRAELREELANCPTKAELRSEIAALRDDLIAEIRQQTKGAIAYFQRGFSVFDEHYRDLPARVTRLEAKIFPPKRPRRR